MWRKTVLLISAAVFAAAALWFLVYHIFTIAAYHLYQGDGTAVVTGVERRRKPFTKRRHYEYRASYSYSAGGAEHDKVSCWVSYNHFSEGQELAVRFDPDAPGNAILEIENRDSASALSAAAIVTGLAALVLWAQRLKRGLKGRAGTYGGNRI